MSCYRDLNPGPLPYQGSALPLSYNSKKKKSGRRGSNPRPSAWKANALSTELLPQFLWAKMDSNHRRRKPADLQSAPFGHSGICPFVLLRRFVSQLRCKDTTIYLNSKKIDHFYCRNCTFISFVTQFATGTILCLLHCIGGN